MRLRVADGRLGAWATGLSDFQDPVVAAAREQAAEAQRAAASARVAASASWRQAGDAARLAVRLVSEAVADVVFWIGHGIRSGSSMLVAWLVSLVVAGRHRVRHGSVAAGRHVRAGSTATRESLRAGSTATRESLKAGSVAAGRGVRGAGRGVRGAGAGIAGAAGGLASRIDALADRGRPANGSTARARHLRPTGPRRVRHLRHEDRGLDATMANGDPAATMPGTHGPRHRRRRPPERPGRRSLRPRGAARVGPATAARTGPRGTAGWCRTGPTRSRPGGCRPAWSTGSRSRSRSPASGPGGTAAPPPATRWSPAWPAGWAGSPARSGPPGCGWPRW